MMLPSDQVKVAPTALLHCFAVDLPVTDIEQCAYISRPLMSTLFETVTVRVTVTVRGREDRVRVRVRVVRIMQSPSCYPATSS